MRIPVLLAALSVVVLATGCGGASSASSAPAVSSSAQAPASSSAGRQVQGDAGAGAKYAPIVCTALKDTLAGLEGQAAAAAGYQAQMVLAMTSTDVPVTELKSAMDDAAVSALCPDDYKAFLEKAGITSLGSL